MQPVLCLVLRNVLVHPEAGTHLHSLDRTAGPLVSHLQQLEAWSGDSYMPSKVCHYSFDHMLDTQTFPNHPDAFTILISKHELYTYQLHIFYKRLIDKA